MQVAFMGLGAVGGEVLRYLAATDAQVAVLGALVADAGRRRECAALSTIDELLAAEPDLVIECARQHVLGDAGPKVLRSGTSLIVASVGALASEEVFERLRSAADAGPAQIFVPAGALAGIDALAAAKHVGIESVRYTRRAPPSTWVKSGAMQESDASALGRAHVIFEGTARDAARRYPKNANVTATIALAGLGFERTRVTLLADPAATSNVHVIEAEGAFGRLCTEISATPIAGSTSSSIVAGSLARAILGHVDRIAV